MVEVAVIIVSKDFESQMNLWNLILINMKKSICQFMEFTVSVD